PPRRPSGIYRSTEIRSSRFRPCASRLMYSERALVVGRRTDAGDDGLLRSLLEPLATALHGVQELVQVDLERRQDAVRPVLHLEPGLTSLPASVVDDVVRLSLRELHDLR